MAKRSENPKNLKLVTTNTLFVGIFIPIVVRWCVAGYPYSGQNKPPMYGDYEAQRHWQEITLHLPPKDWYYNCTQNDLEYWGLDYPPLTAYHSFLLGTIADFIEPESVRLFASRGYESDSHKTFMRWSVFIPDLYIYIFAVFITCYHNDRFKESNDRNIFMKMCFSVPMFLLYPAIILIDYGHFQYNTISLGLFLWSCYFLLCVENIYIASIIFVCSLNYKQMELYHALPIFFYLLRVPLLNKPNRMGRYKYFQHINYIGVCVITTFILLWMPLVTSLDDILQVLHRLFPLNRGVFEDKVSNVWCAINVLVKLRKIYTNTQMAKICLLATLIAALPSCIDLLIRPNKRKLILSFINVSLSFFLFSFQVHEKSILLSAVPVLYHFPSDPFMSFWFLLVANFSMLPLYAKDGLLIAFVGTNIIYMTYYSLCFRLSDYKCSIFCIFNANTVYRLSYQLNEYNISLYRLLSVLFTFSCLGMLSLSVLSYFVKPPAHLPDLYPLLISVYSCVHFIMFYLYFNFQQFIIPTYIPRRVKLN